MSDQPRFARPASSCGEKCTAELKTLVPESLRDELVALAVINRTSISEYLRNLIETHCRGHVRPLQRRAGVRVEEDQE